MVNKFKPICLSKGDGNTVREGFAHCARGYLIPCCLLDIPNTQDPLYNNLLQEHLKISNNESIEDILFSDEWITFGEAVVKGANEGLEHAPECCQEICGPERPIQLVGNHSEIVEPKYNGK